jgi:gamma-glutamylcyclotransferase (GGCT)/AIG2-like uncharacterized protein YtfP
MQSDDSCKVFVYGLLRFRLLVLCILWRFPPRVSHTLYGYSKQGIHGHNLTIIPDQQSQVAGYILEISQAELPAFDNFEKLKTKYTRTQITSEGHDLWIYTLIPKRDYY